MADGNSLSGYSSSDLCRAAAQHQVRAAQRRAVGSELVGHDGGWRDALLLQEFSHQLERRLAVSPWLNEDVQDLAFAVHGAPDVQLSAVDGDEHFVEMPPPVRPRPSSSQLVRNDPAELQSPAADRLVGHIDATLGKHILDVAVAQSEAEIEPDGLLDDDARKAAAAV